MKNRTLSRYVQLSAGLAVLAVFAVLSTQAHAFSLQKRTAEAVSFDALVGDGRWTLVMLWTTDCVPCEEQKPMIDAFHVSHVDADARVVGVALDGIQHIGDINKVMRRTPTRFPNYVASSRRFYEEYEARTGKAFTATPTYLLYNPAGKYMGAHTGKISRAALEDAISG